MHQKRGEILKGFKGPFFLCSAKMPLLITTKLKDGGEVIWHFFFRLGLAGPSTLFNSGEEVGGMYERTCVPLLYYTMVMVPPLLYVQYTLVDLNKRKVLA